QPGHLGSQIVGVDVQVYPARPLLQPLGEQLDPGTGQCAAVVLGMPLVPSQRLPDRGLPEGDLPVVIAGRDVDDHLAHPAEVRHARCPAFPVTVSAAAANCSIPSSNPARTCGDSFASAALSACGSS